VTETFAVAGGGFRLVAVASPSEAVLDYYELEGRRVADHGWRLEPAATPRLVTLPLVAHRGRPSHPGRRRPPPAAVRAGRRPGPPGPQRPPLTRDQPGSRARQWTVPLTGGSAAVPMAGSSWVAPGWMGTLRLTAPTPTRSPLML
jgi:hypothetical protein